MLLLFAILQICAAQLCLQQLQDVALQFYPPFSSGNISVYSTILHPDWVDNPLAPGQRPGRDGIQDVVNFFQSFLANATMTILDVFAVKDSFNSGRVCVRGLVQGNYKGGFLGIPGQNQVVSFRTSDVHKIVRNQIVETSHLEDFLGLYFQAGGKVSF